MAALEPAAVVPPHACVDTNALERNLTMLSGVDEHMKKMQLSQTRIAEDESVRGQHVQLSAR